MKKAVKKSSLWKWRFKLIYTRGSYQSYQAITFLFHKIKKQSISKWFWGPIFKISRESLPLVAILCSFRWQILHNRGVFQRSKGRGHKKFSRGQAPEPPFLLASLAFSFSPPTQYEFRSDEPVLQSPPFQNAYSFGNWNFLCEDAKCTFLRRFPKRMHPSFKNVTLWADLH